MSIPKKNILIIYISLVIFCCSILFFFYIRSSNEKNVLKKYDIECFAGCRSESKCPMVMPYYTYLSDEKIKEIMKTLDLSDTEFEKLKVKCENGESWEKINRECFAGCRNEKDCAKIMPYYMYSSDKKVERIMKLLNLSKREFEKMKKQCENKE